MGQASAAGVGAGAMQTGAQNANLYGQMGAGQAGAHLAGGQAWGQAANTIGDLSSDYMKYLGAQPPRTTIPGVTTSQPIQSNITNFMSGAQGFVQD